MLQSSPMTAPARTWAWFQTRVFGPILAPRSTSAVGWITLQYLDDPACRRAVAEGWLRRRLRSRPLRRLDDAFRVAAGEDVPAAPKRLRPLRFSPQRNTGHREEVSLALDAARGRPSARRGRRAPAPASRGSPPAPPAARPPPGRFPPPSAPPASAGAPETRRPRPAARRRGAASAASPRRPCSRR